MRTVFALIMIGLLAAPSGAQASDVTHLMGTTAYMVREAKQAGANKKDPDNYKESLKYHKMARRAFRSELKKHKGRNLDLAIDYAHKAYNLARLARDNSQPWPYAGSQDNFYKSIR